MERLSLVLVTGLSGSGKTTVAKAFEDLGYWCVDNLPVPLLDDFVGLTGSTAPPIERAVVVMDGREGPLLGQVPEQLEAVRGRVGSLKVLFLECSDESLMRRFRETRRAHPLDPASVLDGIERERGQLSELRALADITVDTSSFTVHDLRNYVMVNFGGDEREPLRVRLVSFGFRYSLPQDADLVLDVRFLPNPHWDDELRPHDGREAPVRDFVFRGGEADELLHRFESDLRFLLPRYRREGKTQLTVAIGCTGGRHRSVAMVEALGDRLGDVDDTALVIRHRDVDRRQ